MVTAATLIRNTGRLTVAYVLRKALTFAYFTLIARYRSVADAGLYFLVMSLAMVCTSLMDFGLSTAMVREGARQPALLPRYLDNALGLKAILGVTVALLGAALIGVMDYPAITKQLVHVVIITMLFETVAESLYACLRAHHLMQYEAWGLVVGQVITVVVGGIALLTEGSILYLVGALLLNQCFNCGFALYQVRRRLGYRPRFSCEPMALAPLVVIAGPILISAFFDRVLFANTLLLSWMTGPAVVGMFSVPSSLISSLQFIPFAVVTAIFPALSVLHVESEEKLRRVLHGAVYALLAVGVPMAVGICLLGDQLIALLYGGKYDGGYLTLQILGLALIPMFWSQPICAALAACNRQVHYMMITIAGTVVHLGGAWLLIPRWQDVGVALAFLLGHCAILLMGIMALAVRRSALASIPDRRIVTRGCDIRQAVASFWPVAVAALCMGAVVVVLKGVWHVLLVVGAGAAVYGAVFLVTSGTIRRVFDRHTVSDGGWRGAARGMLG